MDLNLLLTVAILLLLLVAGGALLTRRRPAGHLAYRLGPEYERAAARSRSPARHGRR